MNLKRRRLTKNYFSDRREISRIRTKLTMEEKIESAQRIIREYFEHFGGRVFVVYGGGIKSDVLRHIVKQMYPGVDCIYFDNGTDYDVIRDYAAEVAEAIYQERNFGMKQYIENYGYPCYSKYMSNLAYNFLNAESVETRKICFERMTGIQCDTMEEINEIDISQTSAELLKADFKVCGRCCRYLFESFIRRYIRISYRAPIFPSILSIEMKREIMRRGEHYYHTYDCERNHTLTEARCFPFVYWYRKDFLRYIKEHNIPYCKEFYGEIVKAEQEGEYITTKRDRSDCKYCPFYNNGWDNPLGKKNKWELMKKEYPLEYKEIVEGGRYFHRKWKPTNEGLGFGHTFDFVANAFRDENYKRY